MMMMMWSISIENRAYRLCNYRQYIKHIENERGLCYNVVMNFVLTENVGKPIANVVKYSLFFLSVDVPFLCGPGNVV